MGDRPSIAELVERAVSSGLNNQPPKKRRDAAARAAEQRALKIIASRNPADDSDFDDTCMSDYSWNKYYKHEEQEYDQQIFNLLRQDKIDSQERAVTITTAISVRDCPEKADEIAMWTRQVKPVLSRAPRKRKPIDKKRAMRSEICLRDRSAMEAKKNEAKKIEAKKAQEAAIRIKQARPVNPRAERMRKLMEERKARRQAELDQILADAIKALWEGGAERARNKRSAESRAGAAKKRRTDD